MNLIPTVYVAENLVEVLIILLLRNGIVDKAKLQNLSLIIHFDEPLAKSFHLY